MQDVGARFLRMQGIGTWTLLGAFGAGLQYAAANLAAFIGVSTSFDGMVDSPAKVTLMGTELNLANHLGQIVRWALRIFLS